MTYALQVDGGALGLSAATKVVFELRRASDIGSFVIIPEYVEIELNLTSGEGEIFLTPNTKGSIYQCKFLAANGANIGQFFFDMPSIPINLSSLVLYTAWPYEPNDNNNNKNEFVTQEIVAGTSDAYGGLKFGGYTTARKYILKENDLHVGATNSAQSATVILTKNNVSIGTVYISGTDVTFNLINPEIVFEKNDTLEFGVQSCSIECRLIHLTLVVDFQGYVGIATP